MKAYRVKITSPTASFRHPTILTGFQPTLSVPPISTIYGLLSAVTGKYRTPEMQKVGYIFHGKDRFIDLETTYKSDGKLSRKKTMTVTPDIVKREIFFEPELYLYLNEEELAKMFKTPYFPILLGRSSDLAFAEIKKVTLEKKDDCVLYGTTIPYKKVNKLITGQLQALPKYFTDTQPRIPQEVQPFFLISKPVKIEGSYYCDPELASILNIDKNIGIYFHE
ncbi:MAG: type I-B CRISPR-associated protein Cas5 [Candidatus Cloacimonadota bacterium]|nr:MAG: type I-B CRISPR-associated protein Cas5 [Candidatus Cloacimonadota bacterium]PIE78342.1 MAG: type I-B CRISPR-associated protein Cas5 [Candidatus Delongbacteria bacterium]